MQTILRIPSLSYFLVQTRRNACAKYSNELVVFRQLICADTKTYTYLLSDFKTKSAVIIDPVYEKVDRDIGLIKEMGLTLKFAINTHVHAGNLI